MRFQKTSQFHRIEWFNRKRKPPPPEQQDQGSVESVGSNGEETQERRGRRRYRAAPHTCLCRETGDSVTVGRSRQVDSMWDVFAVHVLATADGTFHATAPLITKNYGRIQ